ncbi:CLUMA_CG015589, isoform A [Clunio marinus]|uniref:CLUMA_CG015589, isoform A n=1 Tax=Clunio marinus TaxID=568069 RepID=A0A1J1IP60_9DIPT|nr:CLUMA_CG015589, isoform A [Clunio marinus]
MKRPQMFSLYSQIFSCRGSGYKEIFEKSTIKLLLNNRAFAFVLTINFTIKDKVNHGKFDFRLTDNNARSKLFREKVENFVQWNFDKERLGEEFVIKKLLLIEKSMKPQAKVYLRKFDDEIQENSSQDEESLMETPTLVENADNQCLENENMNEERLRLKLNNPDESLNDQRKRNLKIR